ncbi:MAG TPA: CinA family protein [Chloroflexi bacterium]|jgi:PncC family amidohydrolase|nr:CinA family protein [Chloroflexota bacterium]
MNEQLQQVARIGDLLRERGWTMGTAESCTGGMVGHLITELSGSSDFFLGGIIAYANEIKRDALGVPEELLIAHGAVSEPVALAMAQGVRRVLNVDVGVSVTGIAGPTGGTDQKPVGTVYIAASSPAGDAVRHYVWDRDRAGNKRLSAQAALDLVEVLLAGSLASEGGV